MPSDPTYFYITAGQYKDGDDDGIYETQAPTYVSSLTDAQVESLLLETMALIDAYIGSGWTPYSTDQEFIFPRYQDAESDTPFIPRSVSLATRIIADAIITKRSMGVLPHEVVSEGNLGHSYSKHERGEQVELGFEDIPPQALALLKRYRRTGGCFGLSEELKL